MATTGVHAQRLTQLELPMRPAEECRILIVDDDPRIVEYLATILERDGYNTVTAANGYDALERVRDSAPDLVVLDVVIPGVDGIAVCQQIRASSETQFLPVILVTGFGEKHQRVDGIAAGANEFLSKPFDDLELRVRVRTLLRTKQLNDELEAHRRQLEIRVAQRTHELRVANERLEELSKVKGNVIAIVSHEIRTPAMHVKMLVNMLKDTEEPELRAHLFQKLDEAFDKLEYRLDEIQAFSDPTDLKLDYASAGDLLRAAAERVRRLHPNTASLLQLDVPRGLPPVFVDATKMTRVLTHLIDNGVKFGENRPVQVTARGVDHEKGVLISVRDQGPGIAPERLPRLFEPLEQAGESSSTRQHGGFGIGLALVKMVLEAHGVELEVETELRRGATFSFYLPAAEF